MLSLKPNHTQWEAMRRSQMEGTGSALGFGGAMTSIALGIPQQAVVCVQGCILQSLLILLSLCRRFRVLENNATDRLSAREEEGAMSNGLA